MRKKPLLGILILGSLLLSACTPVGGAGSDGSPQSTPLATQAPEGFTKYYGQQVEFTACEEQQVTMAKMRGPKDLDNYRCAEVEAPLDWDDPDSESIRLAVATYQQDPAARQPALFFNLGGPGGDAVRSLSAFTTLIVPAEVTQNFQIVAVDPRGVGESTPVTCWDDEERDAFFSEPADSADLSLDETVEAARNESAELYQQCYEKSGEILNFVDTDSAVRDFDMIRALLGEEQMNYLGYSYGTALGATYADLFPDRVGKFVLDGALDPQLSADGLSALQAAGMEESLYHWIETCQQGKNCPLTGGLEDGKQQMREFFEQVEKDPLPTDDPERPLTSALAYTGVIGSLYSLESYPLLTTGMQMALQGDGSVLLLLADYYNGREDDGTFDNSQDSFLAINSLDYGPVGTPEEWQQQADSLAEDYPVLGSNFGFASAGLAGWPAEARAERRQVSGTGADPILVIGTTHDPATPYSMAESLAESLESAILVTYDGWGHGAYQQGGSSCLLDVVNGYLIQGTVPEAGVTCQ